MALSAGDAAPAFTLDNDAGGQTRLSDFKGKTLVIYFYPRDNTPGCTVEAQAFRDLHGEFAQKDVTILGVSPDSVASHQKFKAKYELPFTLLSDPDHAMLEAYGAWGEKTLYGKKSMGVIRSTVIIGPDGRVIKAWPKVQVKGHAEAVLSACAV